MWNIDTTVLSRVHMHFAKRIDLCITNHGYHVENIICRCNSPIKKKHWKSNFQKYFFFCKCIRTLGAHWTWLILIAYVCFFNLLNFFKIITSLVMYISVELKLCHALISSDKVQQSSLCHKFLFPTVYVAYLKSSWRIEKYSKLWLHCMSKPWELLARWCL